MENQKSKVSLSCYISREDITSEDIPEDRPPSSVASSTEITTRINIIPNDNVPMEKVAVYGIPDRSAERLGEWREPVVMNLEQLKLNRDSPSQRSYCPQTYESLVNLYKEALEKKDEEAKKTIKTKLASLKNELEKHKTAIARALCFWKILCLILTIVIVVFLILMRLPVQNTYYLYE